MKNREIAQAFNEIAELLELKGENPFRIRAYRKAAQNIEALSRDVAGMTGKELISVPGIGRDLAGKIEEYVNTGRMGALEKLRKETPRGLLEIMTVPGVGPKTAKLLFDNLHIQDIDELEKYAREGRLRGLSGIKGKTEENILRGIGFLRRGRERNPLGRVLPVAEDILERLARLPEVKRIALAGSLRRWKETVKDIDILATSSDPKKVMNAFVYLPGVAEVLMQGVTKSSVTLEENIQVDLRVVAESSYGAALQYFTGSKAHNIRIREMAVRKGLKINEYGVFRESDNQQLGGEAEEDVYRLVGLQYIPPELREDSGEVEAAANKDLPNLITANDVKGDLHVHSRWSDGSHSIEEIAGAARVFGYEYIVITDHSKGLGIARGLTAERLLKQKEEIIAINSRLKGFRIFSGVEVDIKSDGALDLPDVALQEMDFVVASIHSGFRQPAAKLTKRLISAMQSPYVRLIAHPTGRLLGERDAYEVDMAEVLRAAKETGTTLEINAYPLRLDLNDMYIREAKKQGISLAICTDTHFSEQFNFMRYGVATARRGWIEAQDVINTKNLQDFEKWIQSGKKQGKKV